MARCDGRSRSLPPAPHRNGPDKYLSVFLFCLLTGFGLVSFAAIINGFMEALAGVPEVELEELVEEGTDLAEQEDGEPVSDAKDSNTRSVGATTELTACCMPHACQEPGLARVAAASREEPGTPLHPHAMRRQQTNNLSLRNISAASGLTNRSAACLSATPMSMLISGRRTRGNSVVSGYSGRRTRGLSAAPQRRGVAWTTAAEKVATANYLRKLAVEKAVEKPGTAEGLEEGDDR